MRDPETQEQKETHPGSSDALRGPQAQEGGQVATSLPPSHASLILAQPGDSNPRMHRAPSIPEPKIQGAFWFWGSSSLCPRKAGTIPGHLWTLLGPSRRLRKSPPSGAGRAPGPLQRQAPAGQGKYFHSLGNRNSHASRPLSQRTRRNIGQQPFRGLNLYMDPHTCGCQLSVWRTRGPIQSGGVLHK